MYSIQILNFVLLPFRVIDLGVMTPCEKILETAIKTSYTINFIIVEDNPLEDLSTLQSIYGIVHRGNLTYLSSNQ